MTPDPPADKPPRGGPLRFSRPLPGIVTAVTGVVTALATLYAVHAASGGSAQTIAEPAWPAPEVSSSVDAGSVAARADSAPAVDDARLGDETTALLADCADGSASSCLTLLDVLVGRCHHGDPYHCDVLYRISPVQSDHEAYGATCGGRFGPEHAGRCSGL
jgi:hypothetical protein